MKKILYVLLSLLSFNIFATTLDNTIHHWGIAREKNHQTPKADPLKFNITDYDAYFVGDTNEKVIYLTFDEGYEKGYTPAILDVLKANEVPAIFFVTSPYVASCPDLIKRMVEEGHIVANHTKSHKSMPQCANDPNLFNSEIADLEKKYEEIIGTSIPKLFRPPMGQYSQKSLAMTKDLGYQTIFWSFAYADFDVNKQPDPTKAAKLISDNLHNGAILLLHAVSKTNTQILDSVIKDAKAQGYTFKLWPLNENNEIDSTDDLFKSNLENK